MDPKGLIQVCTGDGKGKTTAAFGLALRALGSELSVCVLQFLKKEESGEVLALRKLGGRVELFGRGKWVSSENFQPEDKRLAKKGLARAQELIQDGDYDILILDEICVVLKLGLLEEEELLDLIEKKPEGQELILTGRGCPSRIIKISDLVTEMREIKHPFNEGFGARKGIEF